jgi:sec-independent protein translocase protein TatA
MFGLGGPELMLIFGIGFLIFGGKKLPEMGEGLGRGIANFKLALRNKSDIAPAKELPAQETEKTT